MQLRAPLKKPTATTTSLAPMRSGLLQRKCASGGTPGPSGECEKCRKNRLQRNVARPSTLNHQRSEVPPIVHEVLRSPSEPLDLATRVFMEPRFGHDFSRVRVHTDARAAKSAQAVNALAYTVGHDVVFGAGQYVPRSSIGQRLIAHELAHTVQQRSHTEQPISISASGDSYEQEANHAAAAIIDYRQSSNDLSKAGIRLQRQDNERERGRASRRQAAGPEVIVVPPPIAPRLQLQRPWLLGGRRTPSGPSLLGTGSARSASLLGGQSPSLSLLTQPSLFPRTPPPSTQPLLFPPATPTPSSSTPAPSSGAPVNTSVGTDIGYQAGEGHPVAEVSVTLTADWTAAQWQLGRNSGWSLNFLDQPSAGVTVSFNPMADAPEEVVGLSHQIGINALSLVLERNDDRVLEIATTSGLQLSGGEASASVGGQVTYHPTNRIGIFANGNAEVHQDRGQVVPRWGSFTIGLTFDIDQDQPARR